MSEPETGLSCYLFRGVPDILARYKVLLAGDEAEMTRSTGSDDFAVLENAKRSPPLSDFPPKLGQLVAPNDTVDESTKAHQEAWHNPCETFVRKRTFGVQNNRLLSSNLVRDVLKCFGGKFL